MSTAAHDSNPYQPPATGSEQNDPRSARGRLLPVAVAMLVACVLHWVAGLMQLAYFYSLATAPDATPDDRHQITTFAMYSSISMLYCLVIATGTFRMWQGRSYVWAMTTCVLALVPIIGPLYFAGIFLGSWGIAVLRRPEVRATFAQPG